MSYNYNIYVYVYEMRIIFLPLFPPCVLATFSERCASRVEGAPFESALMTKCMSKEAWREHRCRNISDIVCHFPSGESGVRLGRAYFLGVYSMTCRVMSLELRLL